MIEKGSRDQTTTVEAQTQNSNGNNTSNTNPIASDLPPSNADEEDQPRDDVAQAAGAAQRVNSRSSNRRIKIALDLQSVGLVAALVAIPLAYWQGNIQASAGKFEKNQRVVELSLGLAMFWETQLDPETRYRTTRFVAKLKSLKTEEEKRALVNSLLEQSNVLDVNSDPQNQSLRELIKPDISCDSPECATVPPVVAVAKYKAAVMKALNTMEEIAIVREHSKELPEAVRVIDRAYAGAIQQRYKDLIPFVEGYHSRTNAGRAMPAWEPLIKMVEEEDRRLNQSVAGRR